ncbi:MAG TPA: anti-sigma factor [Acidimicrobiia bacterium]|nr:anti-sigma factor [Acidimicrobiia bacterium]
MSERGHLTKREREALIAGAGAASGGMTGGEADDLPLLAETLADPSVWAQPSVALEYVVLRAVMSAKPAAFAPVTSIGPVQPAARRRGAPRHWRALSAAAAAVAVIAITAGITMTRRHEQPDFESRLAATALAPGAGASADIYRAKGGFRVELEARGLPHLADGQYYEAWLKNPAGTTVPIGTFSSGDGSSGDGSSGGGRVTLWSGVSPKEFSSLSISIEATDNDQRPSGRRVLVGDTRPA